MNTITDLVVKVQGAVTESNFDEYEKQLIAQIKSSNKELKIDEDFVEAENTVKQLQTAEKAIVKAKSDALEQAAEVQRMFEKMDGINEEVRQTRLSLQRQIKQRKDEIKKQIIELSISEVRDLILSKDGDFKLVNLSIYDVREFEDAIKGKKTLNSMQSAIDDLFVDITGRIDEQIEKIQKNRNILNEINSAHKSLFQDEKALLAMDGDLLQATIEKRIATHQAEELKRQQAEAEAKADEERLAAEKVKNEQASRDVVTNSAPAIDAQTTDSPEPEPESEFFLLSISIEAETDRAKEIACSISDLLADVDEVKEIKLSRGN